MRSDQDNSDNAGLAQNRELFIRHMQQILQNRIRVFSRDWSGPFRHVRAAIHLDGSTGNLNVLADASVVNGPEHVPVPNHIRLADLLDVVDPAERDASLHDHGLQFIDRIIFRPLRNDGLQVCVVMYAPLGIGIKPGIFRQLGVIHQIAENAVEAGIKKLFYNRDSKNVTVRLRGSFAQTAAR